MKNFSIQVALDFSECTLIQKEIFLNHLNSLNWKSINPNTLWVVNCSGSKNQKQQIDKIESELIFAKEVSNLYELDYAIITDNEIYFNQLNS